MAEPTAIEQEAAQIKQEIDGLRAKIADPAISEGDQILAQRRLDKVVDDYRLILTAVAGAQKGTAVDTGVNIPERGRWEKVNGEWVNTVPPAVANPDEAMTTAIKRENAERDRLERQKNDAAGLGYVTTKEAADITNMARSRNYDDARLQQEIAKAAADNKREDAKLAIEQAKLPGALAQTAATTGQIVSQTDLNRAQMDALGIKTESDRIRALKAGLLDEASAEKIRQELLKPEAVTTPTDQQFLARRNPQTGELITELNPNYQGGKAPTTRGEIAQRTAFLQSQMQQMKDKIAQDKSIPPDQQAARFNSWYDQNVAPQVGALDQQQQAVMQDEAQKAAEQQRTNLATAGQAMQGLMPYRVGPGYGQAFESLVSDTANTQFPGVTNKPWNPPAGWSTFQAPNLDEHIKNLVSSQQAPLPGVDIQGMLSRGQWAPPGAAPPSSPAPAAAMAGQVPQQPVYPSLAQGSGPVPPGQSSYTIPGLNPGMMPGGQGLADFQAAQALQAPPMPMATGNEPLTYNPAPFRGLMPLLSGYDPTQVQNPYQWPFGAGGGGNSGFTAGP